MNLNFKNLILLILFFLGCIFSTFGQAEDSCERIGGSIYLNPTAIQSQYGLNEMERNQFKDTILNYLEIIDKQEILDQRTEEFFFLKENDLLSQPCLFLISCLLYTSPSPRDATLSRMPSSA